MDIEKLKPCPFCGAVEAHVRENEIGGYTVLCHNCTGEGPLHETKADAAEAWNRRAAPTATVHELIAEVARLSAALEARIEEGKDST